MSFQILSGEWKGRTLQSPPSSTTRPTQGILRQAVFNICQLQIVDACFLDLFAGSGAMGLEALSRGAKRALFVEQDRMAIRCINENIRTLTAHDRAEVLSMDVLRALNYLTRRKESFDIVYIDPPYDLAPEVTSQAIEALERDRLILPGALVFFEESSTAAEFSIPSTKLQKISRRQFGSARLIQFALLH
ncbi:MAG: ylbH [Parachlamydiales bacterium]|nr:ylbH [Parachlamydiales bacterium]